MDILILRKDLGKMNNFFTATCDAINSLKDGGLTGGNEDGKELLELSVEFGLKNTTKSHMH